MMILKGSTDDNEGVSNKKKVQLENLQVQCNIAKKAKRQPQASSEAASWTHELDIAATLVRESYRALILKTGTAPAHKRSFSEMRQ